jgi:hypothetical protein
MLNMDSTSYATATNDTIDIVLSSAPGQRWSIGGLAWSTEGGTLDTDLQINVFLADTTGATLLSIDINDDGAGFIVPGEPFKFPNASAIHFEMAAGGANVVGKLTLLGHKLV